MLHTIEDVLICIASQMGMLAPWYVSMVKPWISICNVDIEYTYNPCVLWMEGNAFHWGQAAGSMLLPYMTLYKLELHSKSESSVFYVVRIVLWFLVVASAFKTVNWHMWHIMAALKIRKSLYGGPAPLSLLLSQCVRRLTCWCLLRPASCHRAWSCHRYVLFSNARWAAHVHGICPFAFSDH